MLTKILAYIWYQVHGSVLRILRASADDAGEYTCRVEGGPAHQQASVTVSVTSSTSRKWGERSGCALYPKSAHATKIVHFHFSGQLFKTFMSILCSAINKTRAS